MRRPLSILAALGLVAAMAGAAAPAQAAGIGYAGFEFTGTATLPTFPCAGGAVITPPPPNPSYGCAGGSFSGSVSGAIVDQDGDTATCTATTCSLTANFTYTEPCPNSDPVPPPTGGAGGTFTITQGPTVVVSGTFGWTRAGGSAVINLAVTADPSGAATPGTSSASASFAPVPPVGTCAPGGAVSPQTATVVGTGVTTFTS